MVQCTTVQQTFTFSPFLFVTTPANFFAENWDYAMELFYKVRPDHRTPRSWVAGVCWNRIVTVAAFLSYRHGGTWRRCSTRRTSTSPAQYRLLLGSPAFTPTACSRVPTAIVYSTL
jgi:hypothetical protein